MCAVPHSTFKCSHPSTFILKFKPIIICFPSYCPPANSGSHVLPISIAHPSHNPHCPSPPRAMFITGSFVYNSLLEITHKFICFCHLSFRCSYCLWPVLQPSPFSASHKRASLLGLSPVTTHSHMERKCQDYTTPVSLAFLEDSSTCFWTTKKDSRSHLFPCMSKNNSPKIQGDWISQKDQLWAPLKNHHHIRFEK